jgi:aspartyl protease family protein
MKFVCCCILIGFFTFFSGCSGCSKSGRRTASHNDRNKQIEKPLVSSDPTIVKMTKESGVYKIPVKINGTEMYFIFDTGAGMISISSTEATFLYKQGKLSKDDIIGTANFIDANGDISEGTIILLKEVTLGNRTLNNIEASVVDNLNAPLLFGQSALQKFGKVSIDYNKLEITFEQ